MIGFGLVLNRLSNISSDLKVLSGSIARLEENDTFSALATLEAALKTAQSALRSKNKMDRDAHAVQAISQLHEAISLYRNYTKRALEQGSAQLDGYLSILFLTYVALAQCYLERDNVGEALQHLREGQKVLNELVEQYVNILLTTNPAVYIQPELKGKISLSRITSVFKWLKRSSTETVNENTVFDELRSSFALPGQVGANKSWGKGLRPAIWDDSLSIPKNPTDALGLINHAVYPHLPKALTRIEAMIETNQRFDGYIAELEPLERDKVDYDSWRQISQTPPDTEEVLTISYLIPGSSAQYENYSDKGRKESVRYI